MILDDLEKSLRKHGFAGDTTLPKLFYLSLTTGLSNKPVSVYAKGPSGSGKSFNLERALKYVPDEAYKMFHGMSEKALVYLGGKLDLRHKHLIIQEAAGMNKGDGRVFLRQLLTEDCIKYATVQNTKDGLTGTELPPLEGPCGLIMTTTATRLHPEDESRMLAFSVDENPDRVAEALLMGALGMVTEPSEEELAPWHELYWDIKEYGFRATVPFAGEIAEHLPKTHYRVMRDFKHLNSLVQANALLHRSEREVDPDGNVIATLDDYVAVRDLLEDTLAEGLEVAVPEHIRKTVQAVAKLTGYQGIDRTFDVTLGESVNLREVADHLGRDRSVISRHVQSAIEAGYLENRNPGQGREFQLVVGSRELPSGSVLPTVGELRNAERANPSVGHLIREMEDA